MRSTNPLSIVLLPLAVAALSTALCADVLVVDAGGGGDFLDIQPAVDASTDGDVILVRSGVYGPFALVHQGLAVAADTGADVIVMGQVTVSHTLVEHEVVLSGLRVQAQNLRSYPLQDALVLLHARGPVRLERCELRGAEGGVHSDAERGGDALHVTQGFDVSLVRCSLQGGLGGESFPGFEANRGGDGIRASHSSRVAVHDSVVQGGDGGDGSSLFDDVPGNGGHGGRFVDSFCFGSGSSFSGGDAGKPAFRSAPGGHGLYLIGSTTEGYLLELALQGGSGVPHGQPLTVASGATATTLPGSARHHGAPNPVREGELASFVFTGEPGDEVFLLHASRAAFAFHLPLNGVLLLDLPFLARSRHSLGMIPPGGTLTTTIPMPALPPGVEASKLHLQSFFEDPTGRIWLGSPSTIVVLDSSF